MLKKDIVIPYSILRKRLNVMSLSQVDQKTLEKEVEDIILTAGSNENIHKIKVDHIEADPVNMKIIVSYTTFSSTPTQEVILQDVMKTDKEVFVCISFQIEGLHFWPTAPEYDTQIGFLSFPHRHMFYIKFRKSVTHSDRDIEIIMMKREVIKWLNDKYHDVKINMLNFESMSCEMIASALIDFFKLEDCEVLEDNENGAYVRKVK